MSQNRNRLSEKLIDASYDGDLERIKKLISQGADIHAENDYPLRLASENDNLEIVKYLIERGSNVHAENDAALLWASSHGNLETVKYLVLEHNCNIKLALEAGKSYKKQEIVEWCEKYIKSKKLTDSLELDFKKEDGIVSAKKVKV